MSTDYTGAFKFDNISRRTRLHLTEVYQLLSALVGACAVGSFLNIVYHVGSRFTGLLGLVTLIYVFASAEKSPMRFGALMMFGMLEGMSIGPLLDAALDVNPGIVLTAFLASLGIFVSFSLAALWSDRRNMMYLGGVLSSVVTIMLIFSILGLFGIASGLAFNINLYVGLFVFMGYVVFDTQLIIHRCEQGGYQDSYKDAANLFIDLVAIFIRILIILMKDSKKKRDD